MKKEVIKKVLIILYDIISAVLIVAGIWVYYYLLPHQGIKAAPLPVIDTTTLLSPSVIQDTTNTSLVQTKIKPDTVDCELWRSCSLGKRSTLPCISIICSHENYDT